MSTHSTRLLTGAVVAVLLGLCLLKGRPPMAPLTDATTTPAMLQPIQIEAAPAAQQQAPAAPITAATPPALTKSQQVDKLAKSPSPVDAFTAYNIIRACVGARGAENEVYEHEPYPKLAPPSQACEDLTPGQVVSRMQLLERAAAAGVHGAMYAFGAEGHDGTGITGNEDISTPAYAEWTRRVMAYQEAGVKTGDWMSLMSMSNRYENEQPPDIAKSLAYWAALAELSTTSDATMTSNIARLSQALTPEQAAAAIAEGRQIARAARPVEGDRQ